MHPSFAVGLLVLVAAASCAQPDIASVKVPASPPEAPDPVGGFNGASVDGRWAIEPGAHFQNLTVDLMESSPGATGARLPAAAVVIAGTFSGESDECACTVSGRVTETGAAFPSEVGSYRRGRVVRLFLSFGHDAAKAPTQFATFNGLLIDSTRVVGELSVTTVDAYSDVDGYGQSNIEMRKARSP